MNEMHGNLAFGGQTIARAGFWTPGIAPAGFGPAGPSTPIYNRGAFFSPETNEFLEKAAGIERGEVVGDVNQILHQLSLTMGEFQRAITSATSSLPIRENLEAEAKLLVPLHTPVRNLLPRVPGAGLASAWRQMTAIGGGWINTLDQPGGSAVATRMFFSESGAPAEHTTTYASKSASYRLLGVFGSITTRALAV